MTQHPKLPISQLLQAIEQHLSNLEPLSRDEQRRLVRIMTSLLEKEAQTTPSRWSGNDLQTIRGQEHVKRAMEVAAAGRIPSGWLALQGPGNAHWHKRSQVFCRVGQCSIPFVLQMLASPWPRFRERVRFLAKLHWPITVCFSWKSCPPFRQSICGWCNRPSKRMRSRSRATRR